MSFQPRTRYVNPRLGVYFGIFMSAFAALVIVTLILEQLGVSETWLRLMLLAGPLLLYAGIGLSTSTREVLDFFAAGRRVSAFYSGLVLAASAIGATGLLAFTGAFFLVGFDALCLSIGGLAGFVIMAVLLAPFVRKFGAFTIPSYLGRRFDSRVLRLIAAVAVAVPMLLVIAAELSLGAFAASLLIPDAKGLALPVIALSAIVILAPGGMRSLTWSSVAQGLVAIFALMVPVVIVALIVTNLPIPQLSHGPVLRLLGRAEVSQGLAQIIPPALAFDMPGDGFSEIVKRFSAAMGAVGPAAFVIVMLTTMCGIAGAPWLLPRISATPSVYDARKSLGWATLIYGVVMLTLGSVSVFMRDYLMDAVTAAGTADTTEWVRSMRDLGLASVEQATQRLSFSSIGFKRDGVLLGLPIAGGLPDTVVYLAIAGVIAAALAAAGAAAIALGNVLTEDAVYGMSWQPAPAGFRLAAGRIAIVAAVSLGALLAQIAPTDPLKLMLWALEITASTTFPLVVLSIWWKRLNAYGAIAGLVTGLSVAVLMIVAGEAQWIELSSALAAAVAAPLAVLAMTGVTVMTPAPGRHSLELVRDIRVPGGEILYDREMRLEHLKKLRDRGTG